MAVIKYCNYSLQLSCSTIQSNHPIDREETLYTLSKIKGNIKYMYICKNK